MVIKLITGGKIHFALRGNVATLNKLEVETTATGLNDGLWHNIIFTHDGTHVVAGIKCYIDGLINSLTTISDNLTMDFWNASDLWVAYPDSIGPSGFYIGNVDELSFWRIELTPTQATWIYNSGAPRDLLGVGSPTDLGFWYRMGDGDTFPYVTNYGDEGAGVDGEMYNMEAGDFVADVP
jgi:hypothetical protein